MIRFLCTIAAAILLVAAIGAEISRPYFKHDHMETRK
jgi:hypothetical protein